MNYQGVLIGKQNTDFIAGVSSPLSNKNLNLSGDWGLFRPEHELQNIGFKTYACTIFSGEDALEALFMFFLKQGLIPNEYVKWLGDNGYFKNGFINFSDRFNAQFADIQLGTGTYIYKANNALRRGLIPEDMLPYCKDNYYGNVITPEMLELAEEFEKRFTINWHWVENPTEWFKKSPLQAVVRYTNGSGILKPEGALNHAVMVYKEDDESYYIDDSYIPRDKQYGKDYVFHFVGYTLTINYTNMNTSKFIKDNDLKFVRNQNTGAIGRIIQGKLRTVETNDRGTKMLLDNEHRKNGVTVIDEEWTQLPKEQF
jgi:hypothetical protein